MSTKAPDQTASFATFAQVVEPGVYAPLPDDWSVGLTDVEDSTGAIASGQYKSVNMAGASAISAVMNALHHAPFPFIFGGDGAAFAVPPEQAETAARALAQTAGWVTTDLGLTLRAAMVPMSAVRAAGQDIRVGWYAASDAVRYAVFSGGGLTWAEDAMKAGDFTIDPAGPDDRPDLEGLSCRWNKIDAKKGVILSLIVRPADGADPDAFAELVRTIVAHLSDDRDGHPVPENGPSFRWPPAGLMLEARAARRSGLLLRRQLEVIGSAFLGLVLDKTGWSIGDFNPHHYRRQTARNTDFRKFDDGLRMTVDCAPATVDALERRLNEAEDAGIARYGLHRQTQALMTCIVPSVMTDDHLHFLDGADGGYAQAAARLKAMAS